MTLKILNKFWNKIRTTDKIYFFLFFFLLALYRIYNCWHFNPYWGYDGGEHIGYLFSLIKNNQIPSILENTVAWHEPLYYLLLWPFGKIIYFISHGSELAVLKSFGFMQAVLSVSVSYLIYRIFKLITSSNSLVFFLTVLITFLPPLNQASTFLTNELLNYFFIFLIIFYFLENFILKIPKKNNYIFLAIFCGAALLTKITAVVVVLSIIIIFIFRFFKTKNIEWKNIFIFFVIIILINTPWLIYKNKFIVSGVSINNTSFLEPRPLALDDRINFFLKIDKDILIFPYWYSGGTSFWSMFFADSFYDYYGSIENRDYVNYLIENNPDKLVRTTHAPSYVTSEHKNLADILVYFGMIMTLITLVGFGFLLFSLVKKKRDDYLFYSLITFGFLSAIIFSAYRYPYYDHGIVKSIFVFPFYIFPIWGFFEMIKKNKYITIFFKTVLCFYILILLKYYLIFNFGY